MKNHGYKFYSLWLGLLLTACAGSGPAAELAPPVDPAQSIIFHNGAILTMDPDRPVAEAIAIRGEKIEAVGGNAEILALRGAETAVIDLAGRALMPGFVDAHTHILNDARSRGNSLDQAQYLALRNGITTIGDLYVDEPFLREMQAFDRRGELRVRTSLYLVANTNCGRAMGNWYKKYPPTRLPGELLRIGGVKIFTDGGSCGGVALSFELEPGRGLGDLWLSQEALNRMVSTAQAEGHQVAIHAIGDRAVEQAQEAIAQALDGGPNSNRHRIEHLSVLRPEMIPRFGELGIVPVINGQYPTCMPFGPPLPDGYREWEWPWRELRAANPGLPIAWHSDYPFLSINPFVHLYGFVTRNDVYQIYSCRARDWLLDDTLTVQEALSIMTIQSAYGLFRNEEVGSLQPSKYADVIVISSDPLAAPVEELRRLSVLVTMVGGRFEYCNPRNPELCPAYHQRTPRPLPDLRPPVPIRWLALILAPLLPLIAGLWYRRLGAGRSHARFGAPRLGGIAAMAGGGLWLWAIFLSRSNTLELAVWPLVGACILLATASLGLAGIEHSGRLRRLGSSLAWLGMVALAVSLVLSAWFRVDIAWLALMLGLLGHLVGLTLLGLGNWIARRRALLDLLPLAVSLLAVLLPLAASFIASMTGDPWMIFGNVVGLGWMAIGLLSLAARRAWNLNETGGHIPGVIL